MATEIQEDGTTQENAYLEALLIRALLLETNKHTTLVKDILIIPAHVILIPASGQLHMLIFLPDSIPSLL